MSLLAGCVLSAAQAAVPLTITVAPRPAETKDLFKMGSARSPSEDTLTLDRHSLLLNGRRWTPVMGEFHYTRYPAEEWREELLKMKAGGISILATYVFWIHHEESEGVWNWSGRHGLRRFVDLAGEVGLKVVVRCGPWCHGEVRNGGLPDWTLQRGWQVRTEDPPFMTATRKLYEQIARQLEGRLWKDGGPVIGVQVDNEYGGPAEYLLALKALVREVGLDVPLYTRTGWPALKTPMPFGEIVPLYGAYAEGFWDRELTSMPGKYWSAFRFSTLRIDDNIANEQLGRREAKDAPDVARYPYLTCEVGGGMMNSYHRRILIGPADVEATTLVKIGSGSTLPGYYMYHGGTNPEGALTTLMEAQDTLLTNWNDLPVKNYDFQAPLGEFGQLRPQYHRLRRLHLWLDDFGAELAEMPVALPDVRPAGKDDATTLRWAVRSDGRSGYVFVSHYERGRALVAPHDVQFEVNLPAAALTFPDQAVDIPAGTRAIWPFGLELGHGVRLDWATAQPLCVVEDGDVRTVFFAETADVPARFAFAGEAMPRTVFPGRDVAWRREGAGGGAVQIVVLSEADSLALWKGRWQGRERVFLTNAGLMIDGDVLQLVASDREALRVAVYPAVAESAVKTGVFATLPVHMPAAWSGSPKVTAVAEAGSAREVTLGKIAQPVAAQPKDEDFATAAVWRIALPRDLDWSGDPLLRIDYVGDVARLSLNGRLIHDDFYNGNVWEIGLDRYADALRAGGTLELRVLPLRQDAVTGDRKRIFMADAAVPDFAGEPSVVALRRVELLPRYRVTLSPK